MSLLNKASIIITPTAYDVGSINAVKPKYEISSTESIANNDFTDGGNNWTTQNDVTFSNDTAIIDATSGNAYINQSALTVGFKYKVSITVDSLSISSKCDLINASGTVYQNLSVGVNEFEIEANQTAFRIRVKDNAIGVISNTSVKKITEADLTFDRGTGGSVQSRVKGNQTIVFPQIETPRLDYSGGVGHWLIEPTSTNLIIYSADFEQSNWSITNEITITDGFSSPDGGNNASKVSTDPQASQVNKGILFDGYNGTNRLTDSRSIWAKTVSGSGQLHLLSHHNNADNLFTITEEWQRFDLTGYISQGANNFYAVDFRGSSTLTEVYLWGGQAEDNPFTTSYIPTSGSTATRDTETANGSGDSTMFNDDEGVLYLEVAALEETASSFRVISISDGANDNAIRFRYSGSIDNRIDFTSRAENGSTLDLGFIVSSTKDFHKVALKYKSQDSALWIDGVERHADTTTVLQYLNLRELKLAQGDANSPFYGKIKCIAVFKEALSDSELQCLTS